MSAPQVEALQVCMPQFIGAHLHAWVAIRTPELGWRRPRARPRSRRNLPRFAVWQRFTYDVLTLAGRGGGVPPHAPGPLTVFPRLLRTRYR